MLFVERPQARRDERVGAGAFEALFVYFFFLLLPFEDSLFQATPLGYAGAAAAVLPILVIFIKRSLLNQPSRFFLIYLLYALAVSAVFTLIYQQKPISTVMDRGSRSFVLYTLYVYAFVYFQQTSIRVNRAVAILMLVVLASIAMSVLMENYLDGASPLHYNASTNFRPRGFSLEASTFGYMVVASILLFGWMYELRPSLVMVLCVAASLLIQSKGTVSALAIAVILYYLFKRNVSVYVKLLAALPCVVLVAFVLPFFQALYLSDIDNYTSVATRSTMAVVALRSIMHSPFGHGFTGFLPYVNDHGMEAVIYLNRISPLPLNMSEVDEYFKEGAYKSVGAKSLLFDSMIYLGLPFLICAFRLLRRNMPSVTQSSSVSRAVLAYFTLVSLAFYIPGVGSYISAAALGLCFNKNYSDGSSRRSGLAQG